MMQCVANGHEIAAVANLKPPRESGKDELDSFMYQTVGHDAIHLYSECMDVPLYRREIKGGSVLQASDYTVTADDETEDLYMLLKDVLNDHPDIKGISVGAILSNYQRVRVEHVCNRLGLTSFAYLWRRDQKELLYEMANAGVNAILIKVAAIGLKSTHLGKSIGQMYPYLCKMNDMYDLHICGEGGEYETFTVDCPLFKKRIVVEETETVVHSDDAFAQVAYLKFQKCRLEAKTAEEMDMSNVVVQDWKEWESYDEVVSGVASAKDIPLAKAISASVTLQPSTQPAVTAHEHSPFFAISGTTAYDMDDTLEFNSIEQETQACMEAVQTKLLEKRLEWKDVVTMNVFVTNMDDFGRINAVYKTFFDINPSPRALVGANLPGKAKLQIDLTAIKSIVNVKRDTMHVQGISYWAPANIGPYSQSVVASHAFIAGQIGLVPSTLDLPTPRSFAQEAALSLRNLENIVSVLELPLKAHAVLCYCFVSDPTYLPLAQAAWEAYMTTVPPTAYIAVPSLPRGAMVEWQVLLHAPLPIPFGQEEYDNTTDEEQDEETVRQMKALQVREDCFESSRNKDISCKVVCKSNVTTIVAQLASDPSDLEVFVSSINEALKQVKKKWDQVLSIRALYNDSTHMTSPTLSSLLTANVLRHSKVVPPITSIPVNALGSLGDQTVVCVLHVL
ncbi:meiotically up-regulated 71 protein [Mucor ambiguus]|uniref:Diphthine--ammonia ligase n=1 Tax=Mucor ambiguus TaxID=91626 RepID=A0A0C9M6I7_9FUNG|nr:meiotically up-regulated 71 protein [Mucor ambiguus]